MRLRPRRSDARGADTDERRAASSPIGRLEALSDGVFAIVLTLLVLDLVPDAPRSPEQLLDAWPAYLAYLAAFLTVGSIWLNHNAAFAKVEKADPPVLALNLVLLLGTGLIPWPTVLISTSLQSGTRADQLAAIVVFSIVALLLSLPWSALDRHLGRNPSLLRSGADTRWMARHARLSDASIIVSIVTIGIAFASPLASLILYLIAVLVFVVARLLEK